VLDPGDLIDSRIGVHDDNQFEVKLDYSIDASARRSRYVIETYLFVPRSLGLDPHTYHREQFYGDIQAYIRFKTPKVSLRALLDPDNEASPLLRMQARVPEVGADQVVDLDGRFGSEVRLFACVFRVGVRDQVRALSERVGSLQGQARARSVLVEDIDRLALRLADDVSAVLEHFRGYRADFVHPRRARWIQELYAFADEFVSLAVERNFTRLVAALDEDPVVRDACSSARARIVERVVAEQAHRRNAGYESVLSATRGSDQYVHRIGALKKLMSSVLFLDMTKQSSGRRAANVGAGIAAAVAMLFSTIAAIWSQNRYGINSQAFVIALVVSYVFKDRIKEWLRTYFNKQFSRWLWDFSVTIRDPGNDDVVGRCREMFNFVDLADVPHAVYEARHCDATTVLEPKCKPETVVKHVKEVTLHGRKIAAAHGRLLDVKDIVRFNVSNLLTRMDDPIHLVERFQADEVRHIPCPKTYHVNVVMTLRAASGERSYERFRVVLDKSGIRHLQEVQVRGGVVPVPEQQRVLAPAE
jgi:hypothetical protein